MNFFATRFVRFGILSAIVVQLVSTSGRAANFYVPTQYPTIQGGIDAASAGDVVLVAPGSYPDFQTRNTSSGGLMTSCAFLKDGVMVRSEGGSDVTFLDLSTISGPQVVAILALELPSTGTWFEGFALKGPGAIGFFAFQCGNVIVKDCVFEDFDGGPTTGGAAIVEWNASFIDCEFTNCVANHAGAIWQSDGHLELIGCTFRECSANAVLMTAA